MNETSSAALTVRLRALEERTIKRDRALSAVYGILLIAGPVLFLLFPFPLSRVGSVVLTVGFAYMIWRCARARQQRPRSMDGLSSAALQRALLDEQIEFARSLLFNVPFFVGANLFWMGLPGIGSATEKAVQDFVFLAGTATVFTFSYIHNQQMVREELIPLRNELQRSETNHSGD